MIDNGIAALDSPWLEFVAHQKSFAVLFVAAALATLIATPIFIRLCLRWGWVDLPGGRKDHGQATPTMGGIVIFATVFAGAAITLGWPNRVGDMLRERAYYVVGAMACTAAAIVVGALDDRHGVRAKIKLLVQAAIAVAAYMIGFRIDAVTLPGIGSAPLGGTSFFLTVIWIVGIINAVNFTDGLDGLAAGVCLLAAAVNAGVAIWLGNYYMAVMMLLLAGALVGFLKWNFHPARIFLGDAGSLGLGTFLALCSLQSTQKSHTAVMILVPLCALGYPIFDMLLAIARRTLRGQPVWASDRDHIHHRLLTRGHTPSQAAMIIYAISVLLVVGGVLAMTVNHVWVGVVIGGLVVVCAAGIRMLGYAEWGVWRERGATKVLHAAARLASLKLGTARSLEDVLAALTILGVEAGLASIRVSDGEREVDWTGPKTPGATARIECSAGRYTVVYEAEVDAAGDQDIRALMDALCRQAGALRMMR